MFTLLMLAALADPSGIYQSQDKAVAVVVVRQESGWRTEWWDGNALTSVGHLTRRNSPWHFGERSRDVAHTNITWQLEWRLCFESGAFNICCGKFIEYKLWRLP